jgi:PAS domain S-box-containing protein
VVTVLAVDDNAENLYLMRAMLNGHGYQVETGKNGIEALEKLRADKFDLIISDIMMPLMDGFQLCMVCKTDSDLHRIPFIFYTATYIEKKDEELAYMLGADQFIRKPADPDAFMKVISNSLKKVEADSSDNSKRVDVEPDTLKFFVQRLSAKLEKKVAQLEREIQEREKAEKLLLKSEEKYRKLIENANEAIAVTQGGMFKYVNPKLQQISGYSIDELLALHVDRFIFPEDRAFVITRNLRRLKGEKFEDIYPFRAVDKAGQIKWIELKTVLIEWEGKPATLDMMQDITVRKQAEDDLVTSYTALAKTLDGAIKAMAKMVEMKDPYTAGHQTRVAELAVALARAMGLPETKINEIKVAAGIHDIGKIYVPSDILSKPGKLTALEYEIVKTHAQGGYEILKNIDFNWPIDEIVLQHHERLDGSGYPGALTGENIRPEAKLLAVADVVEAMASHRPYRPALAIELALEEISKYRGIKYDTAVVDACLKVINEDSFKFSM